MLMMGVQSKRYRNVNCNSRCLEGRESSWYTRQSLQSWKLYNLNKIKCNPSVIKPYDRSRDLLPKRNGTVCVTVHLEGQMMFQQPCRCPDERQPRVYIKRFNLQRAGSGTSPGTKGWSRNGIHLNFIPGTQERTFSGRTARCKNQHHLKWQFLWQGVPEMGKFWGGEARPVGMW